MRTLSLRPPRAPSPDNPALSPQFLALLDAEPLEDQVALDVGCGTGWLTFVLARRCKRVIGVDRDPVAIRAAREHAAARGVSNVDFLLGDLEETEYEVWSPQLVAAHLCMSDAIIERAGRALGPGGVIAFVCFHVNQWRETGAVSRFAYDEKRLGATLIANDFTVDHLEVEREMLRFGSVEEAIARLAGVREKWERDGRWRRYLTYLERGGRSLTQSHLIARARRR